MKLRSFPFTSLQSNIPPENKLSYLPIRNPREVRLAKILPGSRLTRISCELEHTYLDQNLPEYDALSYCWGDGNQKTWIACNGQCLEITRDLFDAIQRFRHKDKIIKIWIDQLCIDQKNLEERGNQVQLMREIYSRARKTIVWLGNEADQSPLAFKLLERLKKPFETLSKSGNTNDIHTEINSKWVMKDWMALATLLRRPWFGRMWVLQELAVSSSATIICGQEQILWQDFWNLINYLKTATIWHRLMVTSRSNEMSGSLLYGRLSSITDIKQIVEESHFIPFAEALKKSRWFRATDSRDKIYALLGICKETQGLIPDYTRNASELYCTVAKKLLFDQTRQCLSINNGLYIMGILSEVESSEHHQSLPSWVPEWNSPSYHGLWCYATRAGHKAAGNTSINLSLCDDPNQIRLSGKVCDSIELTSSIAPHAQNSSRDLIKGLPSKSQARELVVSGDVPLCLWINETRSIGVHCQRYREGYHCENAYRRTLVANNQPDSFVCPDHGTRLHNQSEDAMEHYYQHFRQFIDILCPGGVINTVIHSQLRHVLDLHAIGFHHFKNAMVNVAEGRRFFTTLGGYMGLGPPGMCPGDLICVFLGGPVPWVIRPFNSEYILVGECYVHGIMDGEVMNTQYLPVQDIVLV